MALEIKRESSKLSELQSEQINSAAKNTSEEKTSLAQETPVSTSANEKQTKGARELATSKKADAQLQATSLRMQLAASESLTTISKPANNVQQLGQPANDQGPVSSKQYAQQKDSNSQTEKHSAAESLSKENAGASVASRDNTKTNVTGANLPNQPVELSPESVKHNQGIIEDAVKFGRVKESSNTLPNFKAYAEFIPGPRTENLGDIEVYVRTISETIRPDGSIFKQTNYWVPNSTNKLGYVESIIEDGKETITKVEEGLKGALSGLKVGDTFDVKPPKTTSAGKVPSSLDPQPDGRYGLAGRPNSQPSNNNSNGDNNKGTQTSSEKGGLGRSFDGSSGGSMGFTALGGGASDTGSKAGTTTEHKGGSNTSTNTDGQWEPGPSQRSEYPPTKVEVEVTTPHQSQHQEQKKTEEKEKRDHGEKPQMERPEHEATHSSSDNDHGSQAAHGDYADLGVTAPAPHSASGQGRVVKAGGDSGNHFVRFENVGVQPSNVNADLHVGPYNFGNPLDAALNETPAGENPIVNDQNLTYTAGPSEQNFDTGGIGLDSSSSLKNTGNPLHNSMNETPAGTPPGTSEAERDSD